MALEFVPRKLAVQYLEQGYRLVPGHEYRPGDYAILMSEPVSPEPLTAEQIAAMVARIEPPKPADLIPRCKRGHFLTAENRYVRPDGKGGWCRECLRRQRADYKARVCARVSA